MVNAQNVKNPKSKSTGQSKQEKPFFWWEEDVLVLNVLGKPNANMDAIGKVKGNQLKISVTEAPVRGRATDHMVKFLAKIFEVHASNIEVVFGRMNVNKQLRIKAPKKIPAVFTSSEQLELL